MNIFSFKSGRKYIATSFKNVATLFLNVLPSPKCYCKYCNPTECETNLVDNIEDINKTGLKP